eukprot:762570-Amphidinium_carterae.1
MRSTPVNPEELTGGSAAYDCTSTAMSAYGGKHSCDRRPPLPPRCPLGIGCFHTEHSSTQKSATLTALPMGCWAFGHTLLQRVSQA